MITAPGTVVPLTLQLTDGTTDIYVRAYVYDVNGAFVASADLVHIARGFYLAHFTVPAAFKYQVTYVVYADPAYTVVDPRHSRGSDLIEADLPIGSTATLANAVWDSARAGHAMAGTFGEAVVALLGISAKSNFRLDNLVYDIRGFLQSARLRVFPDVATASASTSGGVAEGEIFTTFMTGTPDGVHVTLPSTVLGLKP